MYLNQYDRSGGSSVFVDTNTIPLVTIPTQSIGLRSSTDGSYIFPLFVYTPTSNSYPTSDPSSDPLAAFTFKTNLTVSDTLIGPATTFSQVLADPTFRPLYTSVITGDLRNG